MPASEMHYFSSFTHASKRERRCFIFPPRPQLTDSSSSFLPFLRALRPAAAPETRKKDKKVLLFLPRSFHSFSLPCVSVRGYPILTISR